jgi:hypothetical protein
VEPYEFQLIQERVRAGRRARRQATRFRVLVASAILGGAFLFFAAKDAVDGDWHAARDAGLLGLVMAVPAIGAGVRVWRQP